MEDNERKLLREIDGLLTEMRDELNSDLEGDPKDEGCAFYEQDFYFGFGNAKTGVKFVKMYICPESFEIMEQALTSLSEFVRECLPPTEWVERRKDGSVFYHDATGRTFALVKPGPCGGKDSVDIGLLMEVLPGEDDDHPEYKPLNKYIEGISRMYDKDIIAWCGMLLKEND